MCEHARIHERFLDNVEGQTTDVPEAVTKYRYDDHVSTVIVDCSSINVASVSPGAILTGGEEFKQ